MGKRCRLPNGYGSVYKLSGNRRKPYAVCVTIGWNEYGKQLQKIIGYVETRKDGLTLLSDYHKNPISDVDLINITFADAFDKWIESVEKEDVMSNANQNVYKSIFKNHCKKIYNTKVLELKTLEIQNCIDICDKGYNTKKYIKLIASQVYKFCSINLDLPLSKNFSVGLKLGKKQVSEKHKPFSVDEINILWHNLTVEFVDSILITIYTGLRPSELLKIKKDKVFINERYMIGGIKTEAGIDRIIPIHKDIVPIIKNLFERNTVYLIEKNGKPIQYRHYLDIFKDILTKLGIEHLPHDGRHTLATELDNKNANEVCAKLILGHKINDITKGVYTHKNISQLIETIDLVDFKQ